MDWTRGTNERRIPDRGGPQQQQQDADAVTVEAAVVAVDVAEVSRKTRSGSLSPSWDAWLRMVSELIF